MQNKNILVVFTVLLALATLYTLSFNWVASGYEATADEYGAYVADSLETAGALGDQTFDEAAAQAAREFLRDSATAEIYPVFGHTYRQVKEQELNLGLDLKGGMSVTLEVSLPDLIVALSDYSDNADFRGAIADAKATAQGKQRRLRDQLRVCVDGPRSRGGVVAHLPQHGEQRPLPCQEHGRGDL